MRTIPQQSHDRQGAVFQGRGSVLSCPAAEDKVDDQHDDREHQQQMDEAAGDMESEPTEQPDNQPDKKQNEEDETSQHWRNHLTFRQLDYGSQKPFQTL
jgi:hypothetical protein